VSRISGHLKIPERTLGATLVLVAGVTASTGALLAKVAYDQGFAPQSLLAIRFLISAMTMAPLMLVFSSQELHFRWQSWLMLILLAVTNLSAAWFYFSALEFARASIVVPLYFTYPALVLLFTRLSGKGLRPAHFGALTIGWLGVWLLSGAVLSANLRVLLFSLAAAGLFAVYLMIAQSLLLRLSIRASLFYGFVFMTLGAALLWAFSGDPVPNSLRGWLAVTFMALISTVAARLMYYAGLKRIGSHQTALLGLAEPLSVLLLAGLLLGERLRPLEWLGAAFILISGALCLRHLQRPLPDLQKHVTHC